MKVKTKFLAPCIVCVTKTQGLNIQCKCVRGGGFLLSETAYLSTNWDLFYVKFCKKKPKTSSPLLLLRDFISRFVSSLPTEKFRKFEMLRDTTVLM